jgi:hypothetical protein
VDTAAISVAAASPLRAIPGKYDRAFYGGMAVALALTVFSGFARSYYLRFFSGGPTATISGGPFTALLHLHGALFTSWVVLFLTQTTLIAARKVGVHRRLGWAGAALATGMVVVGTATAIATARRGAAPPGVDPLAFLAIPLFDMMVFTTLVASALWLRRDKEAHKRLMLLAYISIITAPIARLPGVLALGPPAFFGLSLIFIAAAVVYDRISRGRVHQAYLWGGAFIVLSVPVRLALSATNGWHAFARALIQ